ncbi:unnamed protein product [Closterium sp. NIES-53]
MYLMTCTRSYLAYPLSLLDCYVAPGRHRKVQWDAAKWVLRYLCSTSRMGLVLGGRGPIVLTSHVDAYWVNDSATQWSSQGYTFSLSSGSVSWRSTRSSSVLSSSCEAEIYAGAMAAQELRWLTYLLTDLGEQPCSPPHGHHRLAYVGTRANTNDIFTKALPPGDHQRFSTVLGLLALLFLTGLVTPLFSPTLPMGDAMVTTTTPGGQRVSICTCKRTGRHLATFTRRPGSSLYTLATEPPQVVASAQVSASGPVAPPCSCRLLSHQTLLWHHRLVHPSLPCLHGMHSRLLVSGLPRSLPPLPPLPALPCLPCVEGQQRAAPHSSSFPPSTAPLQTLHMDIPSLASRAVPPGVVELPGLVVLGALEPDELGVETLRSLAALGLEALVLEELELVTLELLVLELEALALVAVALEELELETLGLLTLKLEVLELGVLCLAVLVLEAMVPRPRPPPVPGTHAMALRPSSIPRRVPLPPPPESSLLAIPDPESDLTRAASPTVSHLLATIFTEPSFETTAASGLVAELVDFADACRLDYATTLVAESESASPPSIGGECALRTDVLEDRQKDLECLAAAVPCFASMLLAPEGDPYARDIPTPRSYAEAITGPYSSHWQAAMDAEMAS